MLETQRYEGTPETPPEGAGTTPEVEMEPEVEAGKETEDTAEVTPSTNNPESEFVEKDINEKLQSMDLNNIKDVVNNLINKYFNIDNIPSWEKEFMDKIIKTIEGIVNRLIKNGKLTKDGIKRLGKYFGKLTRLFYGDGNIDEGNNSEGNNRKETREQNNAKKREENERKKEENERKREEKREENERKREEKREENERKKEENERKREEKREAKGNTGEIAVKQVKNREKRLRKEQNDATPRIPGALTRFSGDFDDWNSKIFGNKNINDATELGQYQEEIRNKINIESSLTKQAAYQRYDYKIKYGKFGLADAMTYATVIGLDIKNYGEFKCFIGAVSGIVPDIAKSDENYMEKYNEFKIAYDAYYDRVNIVEDYIIKKIYVESLTPKRDVINNIAKARSSNESKYINFTVSSIIDNQPYKQNQSGLKIANNIGDIGNKLNHYKFNTNKSSHEESALKYAAFDIAFKNTFNPSNPMIKKLYDQKVDLRADLFSYGIYDQNSNSFNKVARDRYVTKKLQLIGLAPEEIEELGRAISGLQNEVKYNYEILGGNFEADQDNFEKIAKIYALGEIIDNIKNLFANGEISSKNPELGTNIGFKFDESSADIVGDYLILKGEVNGTRTNVKYDMRTGKLYMNSFTQQEFNPPKITVGNGEPNTEIGDIGNFDDLLDGYQPASFTKATSLDDSKSYNMPYDNKNIKALNEQTHNLKALEILLKNKLLGKITKIGEIVKKKAGEQSKENNVIDDFLKTFNILPDNSDQNISANIEFTGGFSSNLFILLCSIKDTDKEEELTRFSNAMRELMTYCEFSRGNNNLISKGHELNSVTIFDIDEKDATQDIISLQKASQNFFSDTNGEKDRIKGCESHFDASVQLSFANIIVQKCCRIHGGSWKVSADLAEEFVNSVKEGIENIKKDENDLVAMENIIDDDSMWA